MNEAHHRPAGLSARGAAVELNPESTSAAGAVVIGADIADLASLYDPAVMLVTAPLPPSAGALLHAEALVAAGPRSDLVEVSTPDGAPEKGALERLTLGGAPQADHWASYLAEATEVFASLVGARTVGVRQVVADGPHCPRFHVDRVGARGVLNVVGACTEWVDHADLDRSRLGHAGGPNDATSGLVRAGARLGRASTGSLAVFKGTAWPGAEDRAMVHRSPPADGARRVLLTFDWLD